MQCQQHFGFFHRLFFDFIPFFTKIRNNLDFFERKTLRLCRRERPWSFAPNLTRKTFEKVFLDFSKLSKRGYEQTL